MKKIIDKKTLLFFILISILGLIFGLVFIFFITKMDKLIIKTELTEYIDFIINNKFNIKEAIINSITTNFIEYSTVFITSIIFVLFPICMFLNFYKFFSFGFMIASFIYVFKIKGLKYLLYLIFPFKIIELILFVLFLCFSIRFSKHIYLYLKNTDINIKLSIKRYFIIYIIFLMTSFIISVLNLLLSSFLLTM